MLTSVSSVLRNSVSSTLAIRKSCERSGHLNVATAFGSSSLHQRLQRVVFRMFIFATNILIVRFVCKVTTAFDFPRVVLINLYYSTEMNNFLLRKSYECSLYQ
jgi:hypothetical protein